MSRTLPQRLAEIRLPTGLRVQYAERGDPNGQAIVFLHGYSDSWFSFSRMLPLLSAEYHALALTQRGHGDSDKPACCYTAEDFAADVVAFMDAVGIAQAAVVGHSGGSFTAQRVALDHQQDAICSRAEQERLVSAIPDGRLTAYADTGHAVHWERPEWVARDLEAFLQDVVQQRSATGTQF